MRLELADLFGRGQPGILAWGKHAQAQEPRDAGRHQGWRPYPEPLRTCSLTAHCAVLPLDCSLEWCPLSIGRAATRGQAVSPARGHRFI